MNYTYCHQLEKIIPTQKTIDHGGLQGKNDFGKIDYVGPCPPKGEEHRYFFRIFALKKKLPPESLSKGRDFQILKDLVLDKAEYMGKYSR